MLFMYIEIFSSWKRKWIVITWIPTVIIWNSIHDLLNKYLKFLFINDNLIYVNYLIGQQGDLRINNIMSELYYNLML